MTMLFSGSDRDLKRNSLTSTTFYIELLVPHTSYIYGTGFPKISSRLRARWFVATHYATGRSRRDCRGRGLSMWLPSRRPETPEHIFYKCTKYNCIKDRLREHMYAHRGSGIAPTVGFLSAERVQQTLRGVRGQDDVTETGRRAIPRRKYI